jgi:hypothetical protein
MLRIVRRIGDRRVLRRPGRGMEECIEKGVRWDEKDVGMGAYNSKSS